MSLKDLVLHISIPFLIIIHLVSAPYTKIEESFGLEATRDILKHVMSFQDGGNQGPITYDHIVYPGPVPRSFIGPLLLAIVAKPILWLISLRHGQLVVRGLLGLYNGSALLFFKYMLAKSYGRDVGRWFLILQAMQFHVIYYASRTLPNSFAFGITVIGLALFLPASEVKNTPRQQVYALSFLIVAAIIFRSEIGLLLCAELAILLFIPAITLQFTVSIAFRVVLSTLAIALPIDSYFYGRASWPELQSFVFNAIQGKASDWGRSPWHAYFVSLPRLLINPMTIFVLIPIAVLTPGTSKAACALLIPANLFIAIYSVIPHKEPRFIIYTVPVFTAAAALGASYIWTRRTKTVLFRLTAAILMGFNFTSFGVSLLMLLISSLNYPGGEAVAQLHRIIQEDHGLHSIRLTRASSRPQLLTIDIHIDTLSLMTGATSFIIDSHNIIFHDDSSQQAIPVRLRYDKTEREDWLGIPQFWDQFDYALMEQPKQAIGDWQVVEWIWAYNGMQLLRPQTPVRDVEIASITQSLQHGHEPANADTTSWSAISKQWSSARRSRFATWNALRIATLKLTGGWYIGPAMAPRIAIMRRRLAPEGATVAAHMGGSAREELRAVVQARLGPVRGRWKPGGRGWSGRVL